VFLNEAGSSLILISMDISLYCSFALNILLDTFRHHFHFYSRLFFCVQHDSREWIDVENTFMEILVSTLHPSYTCIKKLFNIYDNHMNTNFYFMFPMLNYNTFRMIYRIKVKYPTFRKLIDSACVERYWLICCKFIFDMEQESE
jgi:hypothetical protein